MKNTPLLLVIGGILFLAIGVYAFFAGYSVMQEDFAGNFLVGMIQVTVGLVISLWGVMSIMNYRRFKAKSAEAVTKEDTRHPVVYLRSFKDDPVSSMVTLMGAMSPQFRFISYVTEEEQIAEMMNKIGPFLAIGQPGEPILDLRGIRRNPNLTEKQKKRAETMAWLALALQMGPFVFLMPRDQVTPDLGAARIYVGDDIWKDKVKQLLSNAQLVVLRAGETNNLLWEVETVAKTVRPERIVFLLPFLKQKQYDIFREECSPFFPKPFPEKYKWNLWMQTGTVKAFLYFEPDSTLHMVTLKNPFYPYQSYFSPMVPMLQFAFKPVYQQLGLLYKKPRINPWIIGWNIFGLLLAVIIIALGIRGL